MDSAPYELLAEIFRCYVALQYSYPETPYPETLLNVCRRWRAVASVESTLWTNFVVSGTSMATCEFLRPTSSDANVSVRYKLTRDWAGVFERRLERAGPSLTLQITILDLNKAILPLIDVISGGAPNYVRLPRWEKLDFVANQHDRDCRKSIGMLISQPFPSLKCLTLGRSKIDIHAFSAAPNLEELDIRYNRAPRTDKNNSFPMLKKLHVTYASKYPLGHLDLRQFCLQTIETLSVGGKVEVGDRIQGYYPSLLTLEFTKRVPRGVVSMSAPTLRHLIIQQSDLFVLQYPPAECESEPADSLPKNREVLEMLARTFPTVKVLDVHRHHLCLLQDLLSDPAVFPSLEEVWMVSDEGRTLHLI